MTGRKEGRLRAYLDSAWSGELGRVQASGRGGRNRALHLAACNLGGLVGGGYLDADATRAALQAAGEAVGLDARETRATVRSGLRAGVASPRDLAAVVDVDPLSGEPYRLPPPQLPPDIAPGPALARPPLEELAQLWRVSSPLPALSPDDPERARLAQWWARRGFARVSVEDSRFNGDGDGDGDALGRLDDLVRVPPAGPRPKWWPESWGRSMLYTVAVEPDGRPASLHARVIEPTPGDPRQRWPWRCDARGLMFADWPARIMLAGSAPERPPPLVFVVEGLTDWLALALAVAHAGEWWPVLGASSGGFAGLESVDWPPGCAVLLATDSDTTGDRYADNAREVLARAARPPRELARVSLAAVGARLRQRGARLPQGDALDVADALALGATLADLRDCARPFPFPPSPEPTL